jgi:small subunit ribosomal protein S6
VNDYEIMLLLDPELTEERGNEIIQRIRTSVEGAHGTWDGHEPWGRRRLEYEIDHKSEAVYHLLLFTAPPETLAEITRVLKITDGVMRHGAFRRVKGASTKAPAQTPAPAPAAAEPVAVAAAVEPAAAEPVTSESADDTVQVAE